MFDLLIGVIIFSYALFIFTRHFQLRRQSKCAACPLKKHCEESGSQCVISETDKRL